MCVCVCVCVCVQAKSIGLVVSGDRVVVSQCPREINSDVSETHTHRHTRTHTRTVSTYCHKRHPYTYGVSLSGACIYWRAVQVISEAGVVQLITVDHALV